MTESTAPICPNCQSPDITYRKKRNEYICEDCDTVFKPKAVFVPLRIFLSYGHDEYSSFADRIKNDLQTRGHEVWYDRERLQAGCDWERYIEEGLDWVAGAPGGGRLVLLMTPHSLRRPDGFCRNEVARALARRVRIIPVMVAWVEPLLAIAQLQWLDMRDCVPAQEKAERYAVKLERLLLALEQDQLDFDGAQSRLENVLEPLSFDAQASEHQLRFTGRQWVLDAIADWLAQADASRVFWITGGPGSGKTALSSRLCYQLREIKAFHFCVTGHTEKSDPKRCVLSIAFQLATLIPAYMSRLSSLNLERLVKESNAKTLFGLLIVQSLIESCPSHEENIVVLIDALDEATDGDRNELASFIASEFNRTPRWLRLIITSRLEPPLLHILQNFDPFKIDNASRENVSDLRTFLVQELAAITGGAQVPAPAVDEILRRSEGVFLYAEWVRQELASGRLSLDRLGEFPQGLGGIYVQYFARQFPDIGRYRARTRPALELVLAARNPLEMGVVAEALGWANVYEEKDFLASLGALFRTVAGCVEPFHKSIREWLSDERRSGQHFVSVKDGSRSLAAIGWRAYLRRRDAGDEPGAVALSLAESRCIKALPYHLVNSGGASDREKLKAFLTDIPAFVDLYWTDMYSLLGCWDAIDDKSWFVQTWADRLAELAADSADVERTALAYRTVGLFLHFLNRFGEAEPFLEKAVRFHTGTTDELQTAAAMNDLAECYVRRELYDEADPVFQGALAIRRRLLTNFHGDTADSINNYGHVFYYRRQYAEAERLYREAFEIRQTLFPANHPKVAEGYNNLAVVAYALGNKAQTFAMYSKAVEIMEVCGLSETWEAALYYTHLGGAALEHGDLVSAKDAYAAAFDVRRRIFGWHHETTLPSLFRLAKVYAWEGKQEQVMELLSRIPPDLAQQGFRPDALVSEVIEVANGFLGSGHQPQADRFLEEVEKIYPRIFRSDTKELGDLLAQTAGYFEKQGRYEVAIAKYERSLEIAAARQDLGSQNALATLHGYGRCLRVKGDPDSAFAVYARLIFIGEGVIGTGEFANAEERSGVYRWTAVGHNEIAFHRATPAGDWPAARKGFGRAVELMREVGDPVELANLQLNLQTALHLSGEGADTGKVRELTKILESAGDKRAAKGRTILG